MNSGGALRPETIAGATFEMKMTPDKVVAQVGIEPTTQGFSVLCSTN
jgi:hypothetical protein